MAAAAADEFNWTRLTDDDRDADSTEEDDENDEDAADLELMSENMSLIFCVPAGGEMDALPLVLPK